MKRIISACLLAALLLFSLAACKEDGNTNDPDKTPDGVTDSTGDGTNNDNNDTGSEDDGLHRNEDGSVVLPTVPFG